MKNTTTKKYMNIPMEEKLYDREYCQQLSEMIRADRSIDGMSELQLMQEIYAHAYVYYNFRFVPKFLLNKSFVKRAYRSVENGVDLEDYGDTKKRQIAFKIIWYLPQFKLVTNSNKEFVTV